MKTDTHIQRTWVLILCAIEHTIWGIEKTLNNWNKTQIFLIYFLPKTLHTQKLLKPKEYNNIKDENRMEENSKKKLAAESDNFFLHKNPFFFVVV